MALQKIVAAANRLCLPPRQGTVRHGFDYFPPGSDFFFEGSAATLPYQKSRFRRGEGIADLPQVVTDIFRVNKAIVIQVVFSPFPFIFLVTEDHMQTDVFQRLDLTTAPFPTAAEFFTKSRGILPLFFCLNDLEKIKKGVRFYLPGQKFADSA